MMKNSRLFLSKNSRILFLFLVLPFAFGCTSSKVEEPPIVDPGNGDVNNDDNPPINYDVQISKSNKESAVSGNVITPDEIELEYSLKSLQNYYPFAESRLSSIGNPKILVIPVIIPGFESTATDELHQKIEKLFFGTEEETGWESVASYYNKSSFGKLNITGTVLPWYDTKEAGFTQVSDISMYNIDKIGDKAIDANGINRNEYDVDKDGYIDAVWFIYSAPDFNKAAQSNINLSDNYWAYTYWTGHGPSSYYPTINAYSWASYDFMDEGNYESGIDAHTYIHETGHLLGLSDYYDYATNSISPLGGVDMMDHNIGDHNMYSKMILGWVKPYIVYGSAKLELSEDDLRNSFIVIVDDKYELNYVDGRYLFNPFDEYIGIEYYFGDNLNLKDKDGYPGNNFNTFKEEGFKIYHIDNRLFNVNSSNNYLSSYQTKKGIEGNNLLYFINNTTSGQRAETYLLSSNGFRYSGITLNNYFSEITLIDETNLYNYKNLYKGKTGNVTLMAQDSALFQSGDKFDIGTYQNYFIYGNKKSLDNGATFSRGIKFN